MSRSRIYWASAMNFVENYSSFPCVSVHSCAFNMHLNGNISKIICQYCALLSFLYGTELAFIHDQPIQCILNGTNHTLTEIHLSYELAMSKLPCLYGAFVIASNQTQLDVRYSYYLEAECPIISILIIQISTRMKYYF